MDEGRPGQSRPVASAAGGGAPVPCPLPSLVSPGESGVRHPEPGVESRYGEPDLTHEEVHGLDEQAEAPHRWHVQRQRRRREGHREHHLQHERAPPRETVVGGGSRGRVERG